MIGKKQSLKGVMFVRLLKVEVTAILSNHLGPTLLDDCYGRCEKTKVKRKYNIAVLIYLYNNRDRLGC